MEKKKWDPEWIVSVMFPITRKKVKDKGKESTENDSHEIIIPTDIEAWAGTTMIAEAWATFGAVLQDLITTVLPTNVQAFILLKIAQWDGSNWTSNSHNATLTEVDGQFTQSEVRALDVCIKIIFEPHTIGKANIKSFKERFPSPKDYLVVVSWSAYTAARKIGTWLAPPVLVLS